jgi:hypothetical protein
MFKRLDARRLYKSFGFNGLTHELDSENNGGGGEQKVWCFGNVEVVFRV